MNYWKERSLPYKPGQKTPFKVSRSKIELFMQCPRCFWLDTRLKIKRPSSPPFNINKAIDELFKKEFDVYRKKGEPHPLMTKFKVKAIPYQHEELENWRHNFTGVVHLHEPTNLHIFGAVDDVWVDEDGKLIVVDYKATAKAEPVKKLGPEGGWQDMYRRQMEIYQWLLKQNGFDVSDTGYFVYATGTQDRDGFNDKIDFETHVFPHHGNSEWVDKTIIEMKKVMDDDKMPEVGTAAMGGECEHCAYARSRTQLTLDAVKKLQ
jgi:CRISPR/Cas system-associated exonuclease Cas4 (RecB family)